MGFRPKRPAGGGGKPRRRRLTAADKKKAIEAVVKASYEPLPAGAPATPVNLQEWLRGELSLRRKAAQVGHGTITDFVYAAARAKAGARYKRGLDPVWAARLASLTKGEAHAFFKDAATSMLTGLEKKQHVKFAPRYKARLANQLTRGWLAMFMGREARN